MTSTGSIFEIKPGLSAKVSMVTDDLDTAQAFRSGDVPVLSSPRLIALCEEATVKALSGRLPEEDTSVGIRIQFDHTAGVKIGTQVTAEATLKQVHGKRLIFTVTATDEGGLVGAGVITRVIIDRKSFLSKIK